MRVKWIVAACIFLMGAGSLFAGEDAALKTQKDKVSYVIGMIVGRDLKGQAVDLNVDAFTKGFHDMFTGAKPLMSDKEAEQTMAAFRGEMAAKTKKLSEDNKKQGDAFLAENKKKEGVKALPSGVQYKILKEGTGKTAALTDTVTVNYRGSLLDGTEFDSSYKRGQPATFAVKGVIPGWTEVLQLMKPGSKYQIFIPAERAYKEAGAGRAIPPNATLIFEVELISIKGEK